MTLYRRLGLFGIGAAGLSLVAPASLAASIVRLAEGDFAEDASRITFDNSGDTNPTYTLTTASLGDVTVSFGPNFVGQTLTGGFPDTLDDTTPEGPLTLDLNGPATRVVRDSANPSSPVLSGTPTFNGVISGLFSQSVSAIGLDGGVFDGDMTTSIEAYDVDGNSLGIVSNDGEGVEFFGLALSDGANDIRGFSFYVTGNEPAGFAIDNFTFGSVDELDDDVIPDGPDGPDGPTDPNVIPTPTALFGAAPILAGLFARRRRDAADRA